MADTGEPERAVAVRASDSERDAVAAQLRAHYAEGRIDLDELERRLEAVVAAPTTAEIAGVVRDLPTLDEAPSRPGERVRVGPPGVLPFTRRVVVPATRAETRALAIEKIAPGLHANGYELVSQAPSGLVFERIGRPNWAVAVAVLAFPIGLIALTQRQAHRLVISLEEHPPDRTEMIVHGAAPRGVRKAFAELTFG